MGHTHTSSEPLLLGECRARCARVGMPSGTHPSAAALASGSHERCSVARGVAQMVHVVVSGSLLVKFDDEATRAIYRHDSHKQKEGCADATRAVGCRIHSQGFELSDSHCRNVAFACRVG
eukprot:2769092-Prymnesium_polylepis.1